MSERLLTKSRYKLALSCPNKLYYTRKKQYANTSSEDPFLEALAQGGFQVEELARLTYPEGVLIEGNDGDYNWLAAETDRLLQQENVVIFEAAFKFEGLFIRTDILVKKGNHIQLIEVKAKSYNPANEHLLVNKRSKLVSGWKPYLFDVAFQRYVIQKAQPNWHINSYLMLANKQKKAQIDGLNQLFRITRNSDNRTGIVKKVNNIREIGDTVLGKVNVDAVLNDIESGKHTCFEHLSFTESIAVFSDYYQKDKYFNYPIEYASCKGCEFKATAAQEATGLLSGFKECFTKQKNWTAQDFEKPTTFQVWNFRKGKKLFEQQNKIFLEDLTEEDLQIQPQAGRISSSERQWIQIEKTVAKDASPYVLKEELKEAMATWQFPLNFIDFETSAVALPFNKGRKPYEQIAFQFSHHTVLEDGSISHASEYIHFEAGKFPNFEFVRALKKALNKNNGSIFKFATHENSILNAIHEQLAHSNEPDKDALQTFIESISHSKTGAVHTWAGERDMIDLCEVVKHYYYDPFMGGSNSIKAVLPAVLKSSEYLQKKYAQPIGAIGVDSKNFDGKHVWFQYENNTLLSPYKILPPLFTDWTAEELNTTISELDSVANGGAALTAYGKLQYTDMTEKERSALKESLLKYCELDTLAMVMIYECFREVCR